MKGKYIICIQEETELEEWCYGFLVHQGNRIYADGNPPKLFTDVVVPEGKTPIDNEVSQEIISKGINGTYGKVRLGRLELEIGQYYPRIYRPFMRNCGRFKWLDSFAMMEASDIEYLTNEHGNFPPVPIDKSTYLKALSQLALLSDRLARVFRTVEPELMNLDVYGHEIRNLLIITCTEVEAQWKSILKANNYSTTKTYSTNDYVKLLTPLRLADYEIEFPLYPGIPPVCPFASWDLNKPTRSLGWYDAYNATKHDREMHFSRATISNVVNALAACSILLIAQFGKRETWKNELQEFFRFIKVPTWKPEDMYSRGQNQKYTPIDYPF
jgi:hypothetical protein